MVQPDPIFVPSPIIRLPTWGIKNVLVVSGIKPNPIFPKTVL